LPSVSAVCQVHGVDELCLPFPDCGKLPFDEYHGSHTTGYLAQPVKKRLPPIIARRMIYLCLVEFD